MATISAKDVMALRRRTGQGMMECKKALEDAGGDTDKAIELLRQRVGGKMDERDKEAGEGVISVAAADGAIVLTEIRSETDFVARNERFVAGGRKVAEAALAAASTDGPVEADATIKNVIEELRVTFQENISYGRGVRVSGPKVGHYVHHTNKVGAIVAAEGDMDADLLKGICQHLIAADGRGQWAVPLAIDESGLPADKLEAARAEAVEEAKATGKPQEIAEKIAAGKVRKWVDDHTLLGQVYIREMDAKKPIRDYLPAGAKLLDFARLEVGG